MNDDPELQIFGRLVPRGADHELRERILGLVSDELTQRQARNVPTCPPQPVRSRRTFSAGIASIAALLAGVATCAWVNHTTHQRLEAAFGSTVVTREARLASSRLERAPTAVPARNTSTPHDSLETTIALIHATYRQYLFELREEPPRSRPNVSTQKSSQMDRRDARSLGDRSVACQRLVCVERESPT